MGTIRDKLIQAGNSPEVIEQIAEAFAVMGDTIDREDVPRVVQSLDEIERSASMKLAYLNGWTTAPTAEALAQAEACNFGEGWE